jgi:hypothetical protein
MRFSPELSIFQDDMAAVLVYPNRATLEVQMDIGNSRPLF